MDALCDRCVEGEVPIFAGVRCPTCKRYARLTSYTIGYSIAGPGIASKNAECSRCGPTECAVVDWLDWETCDGEGCGWLAIDTLNTLSPTPSTDETNEDTR